MLRERAGRTWLGKALAVSVDACTKVQPDVLRSEWSQRGSNSIRHRRRASAAKPQLRYASEDLMHRCAVRIGTSVHGKGDSLANLSLVLWLGRDMEG